jgi:hypothetical protein
MNRNQGITAGAILAAGLMLRPTASVAPGSIEDHGGGTSVQKTTSSKPTEEGPWLASCRYWAPVREALESVEKKATVKISIEGEDGKIESEAHATEEEDDSECPVVDDKKGISRWGFPLRGGPAGPNIHAIIATVDNPVHSHDALAFDREIDALTMAAGDNGYVPSYYWLPWKTQASSLRAEAATGDEDAASTAVRERQPGLIVFKRVCGSEAEAKQDHSAGDEPPAGTVQQAAQVCLQNSNYYEAIYLFLVGESTALGVDGFQIRNAFKYEGDIRGIQGVTVDYSMNPNSKLAIIGPVHSGSAASLRAAIETLGAALPGAPNPGEGPSRRPAKSPGAPVKDNAKAASNRGDPTAKLNVQITGITQTNLAGDLLSPSSWPSPPPALPGSTGMSQLKYVSFGENWNFGKNDLLQSLACSGYELNRIAVLSEDGTVPGNQSVGNVQLTANEEEVSGIIRHVKRVCSANGSSIADAELTPLVLRFPRNISLLRNAQPSGERQDSTGKLAPTPFLHLSLKDFGANDSVPQFSPYQMPLSQEAQLMSISRLIGRAHVQFILIQASNVLDGLYLAQFLHRACPEARIVFIGGDLLFGRETENVPYVGTLTLTAYGLLSPTGTYTKVKKSAVRAFPDGITEMYFNAASYTFWDGTQDSLSLANYIHPLQTNSPIHASLWATVIGRDGYYPLAIVDDCASDSPHILPTMRLSGSTYAPNVCVPGDQTAPVGLDWLVSVMSDDGAPRQPSYPGLAWNAICILIILLCLSHSIAVLYPRYWSPLTRDLVIDKGSQPYRRSMYIFIGTVMLFCMGFAAAYPMIPTFRMIHPDWLHSGAYCLVTMAAAATALVATLSRTHAFLFGWMTPVTPEDPAKENGGRNPMEQLRIWLTCNSHLPFNLAAGATLFLFPVLWVYICTIEVVGDNHTFVGPLFSYRCLYPGSGVCPLTPILLVLLGWYAWAVTQALRLRFSDQDRPRLPGSVEGKSPWPLFVSEPQITECKREVDCCLESNITCLLITRQVLQRIFPDAKWWPAGVLFAIYLVLYGLLMFGLKLGGIDRFLWQRGWMPAPYELLIGSVAFPLVMIALTAWLRVILVWGSLKRGLLETLEQLPLRYAFTRLKGFGWADMMRQGGLLEQWRDMARSTESMRQMVHDPELCDDFLPYHKVEWEKLTDAYKKLNQQISDLMKIVGTAELKKKKDPPKDAKAGLNCMVAIEECYAQASEALLKGLLLPYWEDERVGMVEGEELNELPVKARRLPKDEAAGGSLIPLQLHAGTVAEEPTYIRVAEEFLAIRYVSLIRAVLVNIRRLLTIVSVVFVFTIVAWNSYPFQPRQLIDEAFTALLVLLGMGIIWVFSQMHHSAILRRITDTETNGLGWDFYLRLVTFGAVPVLTWLAYQFPELGVSLYRFVQPGLEGMK